MTDKLVVGAVPDKKENSVPTNPLITTLTSPLEASGPDPAEKQKETA